MSYVVEVAELFRSRFPYITIIGAEDYTAIAEWEKCEIPIEVIEISLDQVSSNGYAKNNEIKSILQIEEIIKNNFRESLQLVS